MSKNQLAKNYFTETMTPALKFILHSRMAVVKRNNPLITNEEEITKMAISELIEIIKSNDTIPQ